MQIFLDNSPVEDTFVGEGTVEDVLRHLQSSFCPGNRMVIAVRCDGRDIKAEAMARTLRKPASSFKRLDVFTGALDKLVIDALRDASVCLTETEEACRHAAELFIEGSIVRAAETLGECMRVWQQVHDTVGKSIAMLQIDPERTTVHGEPLADVIGRPKEALIQVRNALQARDHVLLADILQYELHEVTNAWHALIDYLQREAAGRGG